MAELREIKERIDSIEGTKKITGAMYMISTTKLRHAREDWENNSAYFRALKNLVERLLRHMPSSSHPYLRVSDKPKEEQIHGYLVVTADRGLAGAYNQTVIKETQRLMDESGGRSRLFVVGAAGRRYYSSHGIAIEEDFEYTAEKPTHHSARAIRRRMLELFQDGKLDDMRIIYTAMRTAMDTEVRVRQMLPLVSEFERLSEIVPQDVYNEEFLFLPSAEEVVEAVVPNYITGYIYSALVESFCAEQNSRMLAMQSATDAATSMLRDLRMNYNRARQSVITQEITEVSAGAEASQGM